MPKYFKEVVTMGNKQKKIEGQTPKVKDTEPKVEPGFFGKIGAWIGNEWNSFWNTPTTRAQRCKKAAIILGVAGIAGGVGYSIGYNRGSNSMPDGEDEYGDDSCGEEPIVTDFVSDTEDNDKF